MLGWILSLTLLLGLVRLPFGFTSSERRPLLSERGHFTIDALDLRTLQIHSTRSRTEDSPGAEKKRTVNALPESFADERTRDPVGGEEEDLSERTLRKVSVHLPGAITSRNTGISEMLKKRLMSYTRGPASSSEPRLKLGTIHIRYPRAAVREEIEGRVRLSFVVEPDGRAYNITIEESLHPLCDAEALRALREAHFHPALEDGQPVSAVTEMAIRFVLDGDA